jgi:hypothetical protein
MDQEFFSDVACVTLNHLPPRYFRHEVDMAFYLSPTEYSEMKNKVDDAIKKALSHVKKRQMELEAENS